MTARIRLSRAVCRRGCRPPPLVPVVFQWVVITQGKDHLANRTAFCYPHIVVGNRPVSAGTAPGIFLPSLPGPVHSTAAIPPPPSIPTVACGRGAAHCRRPLCRKSHCVAMIASWLPLCLSGWQSRRSRFIIARSGARDSKSLATFFHQANSDFTSLILFFLARRSPEQIKHVGCPSFGAGIACPHITHCFGMVIQPAV